MCPGRSRRKEGGHRCTRFEATRFEEERREMGGEQPFRRKDETSDDEKWVPGTPSGVEGCEVSLARPRYGGPGMPNL
jgi:hypothetical protein